MTGYDVHQRQTAGGSSAGLGEVSPNRLMTSCLSATALPSCDATLLPRTASRNTVAAAEPGKQSIRPIQ